jgi:hypothetical protein
MAPTMDIPNEKDYQKILQVADAFGIKYNSQKEKQIADLKTSDWIVMPQEFSGLEYSLEISPGRISNNSAVEKVAKELGINYENTAKDYLGREFVGRNNFYDSQKLESGLGTKMPSALEANKFMKLLDEGSKGMAVYDASGNKLKPEYLASIKDDIVKVASPWRAEWLDADFKVQGEDLIINYHTFDKNGNVIQKSEKLDKNTLRKNKTPGISLDDWLKNPTKQGLPKKSIKSGDLFYFVPDEDNNSVAWLGASPDRSGLVSNGIPSDSVPDLGVRAAKLRE